MEKRVTDFTEIEEVYAGSYFHVVLGGADYKITGANLIASLNGGNPFKVMVSQESTTARTLTIEDKNRYIYCSNVGGCVLTLNTDGASGFSIGDTITIRNESESEVSLVAGSGVTISPSASGLELTDQGQTGQLICVSTNVFHFLTGGSS